MARFKQKPATEVLLFKLQREYLETRDVKVFQQIFSELLPYARSLIMKKTRGKMFLPPDMLDSAALESTVKFMSQYEKPDFKIKNSFAGILNYKVLESMYGPKVIAADQIGSLNEHLENGKSKETEFGDMSESFHFTYLFRPDSDTMVDDPSSYLFNKEEDVINSILTVVQDLYKVVSLRYYFLVAMGILQFLKKTKTYENYKNKLDERAREALDIAILEVYKRLTGTA